MIPAHQHAVEWCYAALRSYLWMAGRNCQTLTWFGQREMAKRDQHVWQGMNPAILATLP
jgi:hypothetical protein